MKALKIIIGIYKEIIWFLKLDIKLITEKYWDEREEKINGFRFYSKRPFSTQYQYHATVGLENTYTILSNIRDSIKKKHTIFILEVESAFGLEKVHI